jgi:hypothetical protein
MSAEFPLCGSHHCITCADDGTEMTVLALDAGPGLAWCSPAISPREPSTGQEGVADEAAEPSLVQVDLLADVTPGERILVHAGTAIASVHAADAGEWQ